jgi:putative tributyrin esterase
MALIRLDHVPETVKVNLPLNIIIPDPGKMNGTPVAQRKVLYLLHGLGDDASAWQRYTSIETYASKHGLVVVMPSAGRSFYSDMPNGQQYFSYLTDELPRYLGEVFGLHPAREETYIAGNSMGGYGAVKAALLRPDLFAAAASFSGVLSLDFIQYFPDDPRITEFSYMFGDLSKLPGSEHDPATWLKNAAACIARKGKGALPRLFISCGRQEDIYPLNVIFYNACQALGIPVEYHEEDAQHDWFFWDRGIQRFLAVVLGEIT